MLNRPRSIDLCDGIGLPCLDIHEGADFPADAQAWEATQLYMDREGRRMGPVELVVVLNTSNTVLNTRIIHQIRQKIRAGGAGI